jgi:hypothetical protein
MKRKRFANLAEYMGFKMSSITIKRSNVGKKADQFKSRNCAIICLKCSNVYCC